MQPAPAISRSNHGRTLRAAGWVLAAAGLAEILCAAIALIDRAKQVPPLTIQVPINTGAADNTASAGSANHAATPPQADFTDPFASAANSSSGANSNAPANATPIPAQQALAASTPLPAATPAPPLQVASLPKPTPVDQSQAPVSQSRLDALLAEATALNQRGDTSTAVTRLREALALSPRNPQVISQLAVTYEKMDLEDKALEQWRTIYDMGESAGIYYQAADAKLKAAEVSSSSGSGPAPATSAAPQSPGSNGFQQNSVFALTDLTIDEKPETSDGYKRFTLKIPVKRRPDVKIDVSNVVIQVFFYDQLGNDSIMRTNADVSDHWNSLPADWVSDDIEILDVDYKQVAPEPGEIEAGRKYYGYVVGVYYNSQLQDQTADPVSLLKTNPLPLTLKDN